MLLTRLRRLPMRDVLLRTSKWRRPNAQGGYPPPKMPSAARPTGEYCTTTFHSFGHIYSDNASVSIPITISAHTQIVSCSFYSPKDIYVASYERTLCSATS